MNNSKTSTISPQKAGMGGIFAVACVLFSSHAGGGFATGNQATQYYAQYGWTAPIAAVIAMGLLAWTIRECMVMYNSRGFTSYKELFRTLYHPFDRLEWIFEIYFNIMVICAVSAVIAGAASLFDRLGIFPYAAAVVLVGAVLLCLTIFGAQLVSRASTVMSIVILACCAVIFTMGIAARTDVIHEIFSNFQAPEGFHMGNAILNAFVYAGFQAVVIPTMIKCGVPLKNSRNASKAMTISFVMNAIALAMSCIMLLGWYQEFTAAGETTLPSLYICNQIGIPALYWFYNVALLFCFISTGVTTVYGFVSRFEHLKALSGIRKPVARRAVVSCFCMIISMGVSMVGLDKIIKYGYGYCGYLGIVIIIVPFLTVGVYKNRKYIKEHPETETADTANTIASTTAEPAI